MSTKDQRKRVAQLEDQVAQRNNNPVSQCELNRKFERFVFGGVMQDSGSEFSPCLDRWPKDSIPIEVDEDNAVLIGWIEHDLENGTEGFIRNTELNKEDVIKPD